LRVESSDRPVPAGLSTLIDCPSVGLFLDRAQAVRPDFQLTATNAAAVAALCQALEGLPLALELAAARAGVLTPQQMLDHIRAQADLLVSRQRVADPRHRSLRVCLDWSYQQLPPDLQRLFARLSIFRGGWSLESAVAICTDFHRVNEPERGTREHRHAPDPPHSALTGHLSVPTPTGHGAPENQDTLEALEQLRERSLVVVEPAGEVMRYRLLEVVRQYAHDHLRSAGEEPRIRDRHLEFFTGFAEQADEEIAGGEGRAWLDRCEIEHGNLRAALDWAAESRKADFGLPLGAALYRFWRVRGHAREGQEWLTNLLALPEAAGATAVRARALERAGRLAHRPGDSQMAWALTEESLAISRERQDRRAIAACLGFLGVLTDGRDDHETARSLMEESLAIRREIGDPDEIAQSLQELGGLWYRQGQFKEAAQRYEESLAIWRRLGRRAFTESPLFNLGLVALRQDDFETAHRRFSECLAILRDLDDEDIPNLLSHLGAISYRSNDFEGARAYFEEGLAICRRRERKSGIAGMLDWLGLLAFVEGELDVAAAFCEEGLLLAREAGREQLTAEILSRLGDIACARNRPAAAAEFFREGLAHFQRVPGPPWLRKFGPRRGIALCLEGLGAVAQAHGNPRRAARLLGAAEALRQSIGASRPPPEQPAYDRRLEAVHSALDEAEFAAAWAEGQALSLEEAMCVALEECEIPTPGGKDS
jgi:tetratricopeptide (TPR) repeat protein